MRREALRWERAISFLEGGGLVQWCQQIKGRVRPDVIEEFGRKVLAVGDDERALALRAGQDLLGQCEQFFGGGAQVPTTAGVDQSQGWPVSASNGKMVCACLTAAWPAAGRRWSRSRLE